jgi:hypothetical protein
MRILTDLLDNVGTISETSREKGRWYITTLPCRRRMLVGTPRVYWPALHADEQRGGDFLAWSFDWLRLGLYADKQRSRRCLRNRGTWKAVILRVSGSVGTEGSSASLCYGKQLFQAKSRTPKLMPC